MKTKFTFITTLAIAMATSVTFAQEGVSSVQNRDMNQNQNTVQAQPAMPSTKSARAAAELINYQAVARDSGGNLMQNAAVTVDFEIRNGAGGAAVFSETQNLNTDDNGVFSAAIGSVNALDAVNWLEIDAWLHVTLDGTSVGETAIGSVATSLHAKQSNSILMFGSGTSNPDQMVVQHSPGFPGWGIQYADVGDDMQFVAGGTVNAEVDLATGNFTTSGFVEVSLNTDSPQDNRIYGNSVPIAYGSIDSLGGISTGYGIGSVTNSATGVYEITLDLDSNVTNTVVTITPFTIGFGIPEIAGYETIDQNNFIVRIQDASGTARDSAFTFVVYGN